MGFDANSESYCSFGRAVRSIRSQQGISQEALAERAGLDRTYVGGVERGERNPSLSSIRKIANSLNVAVSELFVLSEQMED